MIELRLSFAPDPESPPEEQIHKFGNIADDVWKENLALVRGMIVDGRCISVMEILLRRPLRKRERDELEDRLKALAKRNPRLDPKVTY